MQSTQHYRRKNSDVPDFNPSPSSSGIQPFLANVAKSGSGKIFGRISKFGRTTLASFEDTNPNKSDSDWILKLEIWYSPNKELMLTHTQETYDYNGRQTVEPLVNKASRFCKHGSLATTRQPIQHQWICSWFGQIKLNVVQDVLTPSKCL